MGPAPRARLTADTVRPIVLFLFPPGVRGRPSRARRLPRDPRPVAVVGFEGDPSRASLRGDGRAAGPRQVGRRKVSSCGNPHSATRPICTPGVQMCEHMCADMLTCRLSNQQVRFRAVFEPYVNNVARDEVHHSVCCLLVVPHLARLSRLCRGRPRPCSRRLPATGVVFAFFLSK